MIHLACLICPSHVFNTVHTNFFLLLHFVPLTVYLTARNHEGKDVKEAKHTYLLLVRIITLIQMMGKQFKRKKQVSILIQSTIVQQIITC